MVVKPTSLKRQAERAELRRGPVWRPRDVLPVLVVAVASAVTVFVPGLMADLGASTVGQDEWIPALGISESGLLLALMRMLLVTLVGWMLWHVRQAPLAQRWAWAAVAVGVLMNHARNVYSGNPATVSFIVIQVGLSLLAWRLTTRPTIHQQLEDAVARAEAAEAELGRLKADLKGEEA